MRVIKNVLKVFHMTIHVMWWRDILVVSQARPFPFHSTVAFAYWKQLALWDGKGLACKTNTSAQGHTQSPSIGAMMKCSLSCHTHNLPGGLESRQTWPDAVRSLVCIHLVSNPVYPTIYPLSFIGGFHVGNWRNVNWLKMHYVITLVGKLVHG